MDLNENKKKQSRWFRIGIIIILGIGALFLIASAALNYFFGDLCSNKVINHVKSPDGQLEAWTFSRDCGATVSASTQVSVLSAGVSLPNDGGNVFVIDNGHSDTVSLDVHVSWTGNRSLLIDYDPGVQVFLAQDSLLVPHFPLWERVEVKFTKRNETK